MTFQQLIVIMFAYLTVLVVVIYFIRPTLTRIGGALTGGAVGGSLLLIVFVLGNVCGLWRASLPSRPGIFMLFYFSTAISCAPIFLGTWWISRRFGRRGLTVFLGLVALIAPARDYLIAAKFPEWMTFTPGIAPIVADAAAYVGIIILGHGVMRLVAGPAGKDRLA